MNKGKLLLICAAALLYSCGSQKKLPKDDGNTAGTKVVERKAPQKADSGEDIEYQGSQWVRNASARNKPSRGLQNRHISLWASHGRYFNNSKQKWEWQRPYLFGTTEDLFTQTIVVPYLIPMLENAGATVFTPRERDWQTHEIIIDNDDKRQLPYYTELNISAKWGKCEEPGFASPAGNMLYGNTNPFTLGTTRKAKASHSPKCVITYQPHFSTGGKYAVYVSYPQIKKAVSDAEYIVIHKGEKTIFKVNQRMGAGTWVYLGSFEFGSGCSQDNCVMLTNASDDNGYVGADAVRFGGGMGNIVRGAAASGMPRCLEGARYYAQWAGAPDSVYDAKPDEDYKNDINVRSHMTNWLAGGSCYVPGITGKGVPFELSLAVHSDAGYATDLSSLYGSLSICTTDFHNGKLNSGKSRAASKLFAKSLLENLKSDLTKAYGKWTVRELYDRNYSETRCPEVPSAIIETLSHQSFPDMILGQDPGFRFNMARSLYKTILRFIAQQHGCPYTVAPLSPRNPLVEFTSEGEIEIRWDAPTDPTEPSSTATSYIVYTAMGDGGFDNGEEVRTNRMRMKISPDVLYCFKISAANKGGESFPTEVLSVVYHPGATKTVMVVNGFHRTSAPAVRDTPSEQGFDMDEDPGVPYFTTFGWSGRQTGFDKQKAGLLTSDGLGACGNEVEGRLIMGNSFDYTREHVKAIMAASRYNVVSASAYAIENGATELTRYPCVDYIAGLERFNSYTPAYFKAFPPNIQKALRKYSEHGGALLVSGAYISADMNTEAERAFLRQVLHVDDNSPQTFATNINGMGTQLSIYNELNADHYAATRVDVVAPASPAFCTLTYASGESACVAYNGQSFRSIAMGFPFECIKSASKQASVMKGFLSFLLK